MPLVKSSTYNWHDYGYISISREVIMTKFTTGKYIALIHSNVISIQQQNPSREMEIAKLSLRSSDISEEEQLANARLFCAASDLYSALENLVHEHRRILNEVTGADSDNVQRARDEGIFKNALSALNNARGE